MSELSVVGVGLFERMLLQRQYSHLSPFQGAAFLA